MELKISAETIARTIVLGLALVNQVLLLCGVQAIPVLEEDVYAVVTTVWTIAAAIWGWWKNNSFTRAALEGDRVMAERKEERQ